MFKTVDIFCDTCESQYIQLVDVPSGQPLPDVVACDVCASPARRLLSCQIAKLEIAEKTHGGERLANGKVVRRLTGHKEAAEQARLRRAARRAKQDGNADVAREVQHELSVKAKESVK